VIGRVQRRFTFGGMPVVFEYSFTVNPQYRLFTVFDPTCDEGENFEAARRTLGHGCFAWGPNAVVARAIDTGTVSVAVEVWDDPPGTPWGMPDEIAVAELVLPGGRFSSIQALEPAVHVGVELPTGAGTYGARIAAYNRGVSGGFAPEDAAPFQATSRRTGCSCGRSRTSRPGRTTTRNRGHEATEVWWRLSCRHSRIRILVSLRRLEHPSHNRRWLIRSSAINAIVAPGQVRYNATASALNCCG
jgi:hypothetical protein